MATIDLQFEQIDFFGQKAKCSLLSQESSGVSSKTHEPQVEDFINMVLGINSHSIDKSLDLECSISQQTCKIEESAELSKKNEKKASLNHNCQKQTVSALKFIINTDDFHICESQVYGALLELWNSFLKLKSKQTGTVKFLSCFFNADKQKTKQLKKFGFENLFENFSEREIEEAQQNLRQIAIASINQKMVNSYIQKSSITRKQNFYHYLMSFRQSLIERTLNKRMSKKIAQSKANAIQIFQCLD